MLDYKNGGIMLLLKCQLTGRNKTKDLYQLNITRFPRDDWYTDKIYSNLLHTLQIT
jgi:hypothetical protein